MLAKVQLEPAAGDVLDRVDLVQDLPDSLHLQPSEGVGLNLDEAGWLYYLGNPGVGLDRRRQGHIGTGHQ